MPKKDTHIRRRAGRWVVDVYLDGERIRKTFGVAASRREAQEWLELLRAGSAPYVSLSAVLQTYVASLRRRGKKRDSIRQVEAHAEILRGHFGPDLNASSLTPRDLEDFIAARLESAQPSTVNGSLGVLRTALRYGASDGELLEKLPVKVKLLKVGRQTPRVLSPSQVDKLIEHAWEPFDVILLLAAHAGLRHQEILHLWVGDVDFDTGWLHLSRKPGWVPKAYHERDVPMTPRLAERLQAYIPGLKDSYPGAWLFPGIEGQQRSTADWAIRRTFKSAGLYDPAAKPGLHALRRTWATELLGRGADIQTMCELGGWADLVTVQRYLASNDERKRKAIELLAV